MPRRTAEAKAAAFYRVQTPMSAPSRLSRREKAIWHNVTTAKPVDWFDPSQEGLLVMYCRSVVELDEIDARLKEFEPGSKERIPLLAEHKIRRNDFVIAARELRLTVQHAIERTSSKPGERGTPVTDLLGGGEKIRRAA